jgi:hypothetical protein
MSSLKGKIQGQIGNRVEARWRETLLRLPLIFSSVQIFKDDVNGFPPLQILDLCILRVLSIPVNN